MLQRTMTATTLSVSFSAIAAADGLPTTRSVDTPIGRLEISNGYPTAATTEKLFDEMDFQRAVQAYLWALSMIGLAQWQNEQHDKFGAGDLVNARIPSAVNAP